MTSSNPGEAVQLTAEIVSAFVAHNKISQSDLSSLIQNVHRALVVAPELGETEKVDLVPAVPIKRSVTPDHITCLEDGKRFKSLTRHLRESFDLTPDEYRSKWGLPFDYPMVAANYSKARSEFAKKMGLGRKRGRKAGPLQGHEIGRRTRNNWREGVYSSYRPGH